MVSKTPGTHILRNLGYNIRLTNASYTAKLYIGDGGVPAGNIFAEFFDGTGIESANKHAGNNGLVIQAAIDAVDARGGGTLFIAKGFYKDILTPIVVPDAVTLVGEGADSVTTKCTFLQFKDGSSITFGENSGASRINFNFQKKTDMTDNMVWAGSKFVIDDIWVRGTNDGAITVQFKGEPGNVVSGGYCGRMIIHTGSPALRFEETTQNTFMKITITNSDENAVQFSETDNMHIGHLHIASMKPSAGAHVIRFGDDGSEGQSNGVNIDYLAVALLANYTVFEINHPLSGVQNYNFVRYARIAGLSTGDGMVTFNNDSETNLRIQHGSQNDVGFNITTPSVPAGIAVGNAVVNATAQTIRVYQDADADGTHIIDFDGNDILLNQDPTWFILEPGEKAYYATAVPTTWKWYAV